MGTPASRSSSRAARVAARGRQEPRDRLGRRQERADAGLVERAERDRLGGEVVDGRRDLRRDDEEAGEVAARREGGGERAQEVLDEERRRLVGEVEIVDEEGDGAGSGDEGEDLAHPLEQRHAAIDAVAGAGGTLSAERHECLRAVLQDRAGTLERRERLLEDPPTTRLVERAVAAAPSKTGTPAARRRVPSSTSSRVLPNPAAPLTNATCPERRLTARSSSARRRPSFVLATDAIHDRSVAASPVPCGHRAIPA